MEVHSCEVVNMNTLGPCKCVPLCLYGGFLTKPELWKKFPFCCSGITTSSIPIGHCESCSLNITFYLSAKYGSWIVVPLALSPRILAIMNCYREHLVRSPSSLSIKSSVIIIPWAVLISHSLQISMLYLEIGHQVFNSNLNCILIAEALRWVRITWLKH